MADGYSYVIEMVDRISGPAKTAKQQIDALSGSLSKDAEELKKLERGMADLNALGLLTADMAAKFKKEIDGKRKAVEGASDKLRGMVKEQRAVATAEREAAVAAKSAAYESNGLNGALMSLGPYAAAAAAALLAFGGALLVAIVAGGRLALEAAKFKAETTAALRSTLGTSEAAAATFREIRKISDEIGISEAKAQKLGLHLLDAGVAQRDLGETIKSLALLEKVRGEQAAGKLQDLIKKSAAAGAFKFEAGGLEGTGLSQGDVIGELAKQTGKGTAQIAAELKAGTIKASAGIAALNAALSKKYAGAGGLGGIEDATTKFREKISRLFEDVNVGPFLELVREIGELFDSSTVSGNALKWLMTTVFDGVFRVARAAFPFIKTAILELVIVGLKLYIAMKPVVAKLREMWSNAEQGESATNVIRSVVSLVAGLAAAVILAAGYWLVFASYAVQAWSSVIGAVRSANEWIAGVFSSLRKLLGSIFSSEEGQSIGVSLITGLLAGITGMGPAVVNALVGVGKSAIGAVKGVLGIASPSKVMQEMGGFTAEGFAIGVEDGTAQAQGAIESAVAPPATSSATSGGGGGPLVVFETGAIQINAASASASEVMDLIEARLSEVLEGFLVQLGGATS